MKYLLSCFLMLCVSLSQGVSSDSLVVNQSPDVSFQEGETGNISCCWKGKTERVGITWLKNQILIENKAFINQFKSSQNEQINNCSVLTFPKITSRDSGTYICRVIVAIPVLTVFEGKGTNITVTAREKPDNSTAQNVSSRFAYPTVVLRCLLILGLTAVLFFYCLRSKAKRDRNAASSIEAKPSPSREDHQEEDERTTEAAEPLRTDGIIRNV